MSDEGFLEPLWTRGLVLPTSVVDILDTNIEDEDDDTCDNEVDEEMDLDTDGSDTEEWYFELLIYILVILSFAPVFWRTKLSSSNSNFQICTPFFA